MIRSALHTAMLLAALCAVPAAAFAGWVSDWTNVLVKKNGDREDPQASTMAIDGGRVRMAQPDVVSIIDYNSGKMTLMNPRKEVFWSGTVDEYVREMLTNRADQARQTLGAAGAINKKVRDAMRDPSAATYTPPAVDPAKLPPVSVTKTGITDRIAGYEATKYEVRADGNLFQEFWLTPAVNVGKDLDPQRFAAIQQKMSSAMVGKSAKQYNALYRDPEYRQLLTQGFVVKIVNHHLGGRFERQATALREATVPDTEFEVPSTYRRVRLRDVMDAPPPPPGAPEPATRD